MSGSDEQEDPVGFGIEDLPAFRKELFEAALAAARDVCDPATDWAGFSEALWAELARVFDWERETTAVMGEPPRDRQAYADELAAAVRERFGIDLDMDYTRRS